MSGGYFEDGDSQIDYSDQGSFYDNTGNQPSELEFQTYSSEETSGVPPSPLSDIELDAFDEDPSDEPPPPSAPRRIPGEGRIWHLSYWQQFCDVDSIDVAKRLGSSVIIYPNFFQLIAGRQDLYGWVWVPITLIFAVAAAGNFASYLTYALQGEIEQWQYDFAKLGLSAAIIAWYAICCPGFAWGAMTLWLKLDVLLVDHYCLYGYSLFPYIPAAVVMIIPLEWLRWVIMVLACLVVCAFLIRNYFMVIRPRPMEGGIVLAFLLLINIILALSLQLYFFEYAVDQTSEDGTPLAPASSDEESTVDTASGSSPAEEPVTSPTPLPSVVPSASMSVAMSASMSSSAAASVSPSPSPMMSVSAEVSSSMSPSLWPSPVPSVVVAPSVSQ